MTCDLCSKQEATVHLTEIINDETRELHLCEPCAREKGQETAKSFGLANLLGGLAEFGLKSGGEAQAPPRAAACSQCGMTYEDFRKLGRFGCGRCYESFHRFLTPLLKRIHGSTQHVGKIPSAAAQAPPTKLQGELTDLRERLKAAIAAEAFEEAAALRDRLRALESKSKSGKPGKKP